MDHANKGELLGLTFDLVTMEAAVAKCVEYCRAPREPKIVLTANASHLCEMRENDDFAKACQSAHLKVADGMSVVWALRASGQPTPERVAGIDLMVGLLAAAESHGLSVYFLGATPEVVAKLVEKCGVDFPKLKIAGYRDGYFGPESHAEVIADVRASGADMLFVGMPSPFKDTWCERNREQIGVPVIVGVGGSFDVLAGFIERAPGWMQNAGLEWFWRFINEPRRLWKRYLVTNSQFMWLASQEIIARRLGWLPVTHADNTRSGSGI